MPRSPCPSAPGKGLYRVTGLLKCLQYHVRRIGFVFGEGGQQFIVGRLLLQMVPKGGLQFPKASFRSDSRSSLASAAAMNAALTSAG